MCHHLRVPAPQEEEGYCPSHICSLSEKQYGGGERKGERETGDKEGQAVEISKRKSRGRKTDRHRY